MPNEVRLRLRNARLERGWTQQQLADRLGTTANTIGRWELGVVIPSPYFRVKLSELLETSIAILGLSEQDAYSSHPCPSLHCKHIFPLWTIPIRRNPFFTGREELLQAISDALQTHSHVALMQAICGLGGIGKTQTAIEYAYQHRQNYEAVLWMQASDEHNLFASLAKLAQALQLVEKEQVTGITRISVAVQSWLQEHKRWLLIVDSVEDVNMISDLLPMIHSGHVLLTTRTHFTGPVAQTMSMSAMTPPEGATFLLRRAKRISRTASLQDAEADERVCALEIADQLGGLPLALDQAAAYLEETACSLHSYLNTYQKQRVWLLSRRGTGIIDHPQSVAATFTLAMSQAESAQPEVVNLLRFCTFLQPDAIAEDLLRAAASELDPALELQIDDPLALDHALSILLRYSLLSRHPRTQILTIHRLVQSMVRDIMDVACQRTWAEHVVRAVNKAFPMEVKQPANWLQCQQCLPHVLVCWDHIEQWQLPTEAGIRLLYRAGRYLIVRGQYKQAEPLILQAHKLCMQQFGSNHLESATTLSGVADLHFYQGRYQEAERLFQQVVALREQVFPTDHPLILEGLSSLAVTHQEQGRYQEAERLFGHVLERTGLRSGPPYYQRAHALCNLGIVLRKQGRYDEAHRYFMQALACYEFLQEDLRLDVAFCLEQLGILFRERGNQQSALQPLEQALAMREQVCGSEAIQTARSLDVLGELYTGLGRYQEAFTLLSRALSIRQQVLGPNHFETALSYEKLGSNYLQQRQYAEAEPLLWQALQVLEEALGVNHPNVGTICVHLAKLFVAQGHYDQAEPWYQRIMTIWEQCLEADLSTIAACLEEYVLLLRKARRYRQAASYETCVKQIRQRQTDRFSEAREDGMRRDASLDIFLRTYCELYPEAWSRASDLWEAYQDFICTHQEAVMLSRRAFAQYLTTQGCQPSRNKKARLWQGIALK